MQPSGFNARVVQFVPTLNLGGAEHVAVCLASYFGTANGISIVSGFGGALSCWLEEDHIKYSVARRDSLATVARRSKVYGWLSRTLHLRLNAGIRIGQRVQLPPQYTLMDPISEDIREVFAKELSKASIDVVHCHSIACCPFIQSLAQAGVVVVLSQHNMISQRHGIEDIRALRQVLSWVAAVVCVSEAARADFLAATGFPADRTYAAGNPSLSAGTPLQPSDDVGVIGTASNLESAKGFGVLLDAVAADTRRKFSVRVLGGSPRAVAYWSRQCKQRGVLDRVVFLGATASRQNIDAFYRALDALVVPSRTEASSLQAIEAMSRGIPVLASDIPALREVVGDAGVYFSPDNSQELLGKLDALVVNQVSRQLMRERGIAQFREKHAREAVSRRYADIYTRAISTAGSI